MALEIWIVKDFSKPYWEDEDAFLFGEVDPYEWESLVFKDLDVMTFYEYAEKAGDTPSYEDYYSTRISQIKEKFPMIIRIRDYYQDAFFVPDELDALRKEILSLKNIVKFPESVNLLIQLLETSERAAKNNAGLQLIAD